MTDIDKINLNSKNNQTTSTNNTSKTEEGPIEINFSGDNSSNKTEMNNKFTIWDMPKALEPKENKPQYEGPILFKKQEAQAKDPNDSLNQLYKEHAKFVDHSTTLSKNETLKDKIKEVYPDADDSAIKAIMDYNELKSSKIPKGKEILLPGELKTKNGTFYAYPESADYVAQNLQNAKKTEDIKQTCELQISEQPQTPEDKATLIQKYQEHAKLIDHSVTLNDQTIDEKIKEVYPNADESAKKAVMDYNEIKDPSKMPKEILFPGELKTEKGTFYAFPDSAEQVGKSLEDKKIYEEHEKHLIHAASLKPGETLWGKTKEIYPTRDQSVINAIITYNKIEDPTKIRPDQTLYFPAKVETEKGTFYAYPDSAEKVVAGIKEKEKMDTCIAKLNNESETAIVQNDEQPVINAEQTPAATETDTKPNEDANDMNIASLKPYTPKETIKELAQQAAEDAKLAGNEKIKPTGINIQF